MNDVLNFKSITTYRVALPLKFEFKTAKGTVRVRESIIVRIEDQQGYIGYGECVAFTDPFYTTETVEKLGIDPAIAFKTLMVKLEPTGEFVVGCVPALAHLSMKLIAKAAGAKNAAMADPAVAQRRTGYVVGGISPLGQTTHHRIFIDSSCLDHETMLVSGGRRGVSVELSPLDLAEIVGAEVVDLAAQA